MPLLPPPRRYRCRGRSHTRLLLPLLLLLVVVAVLSCCVRHAYGAQGGATSSPTAASYRAACMHDSHSVPLDQLPRVQTLPTPAHARQAAEAAAVAEGVARSGGRATAADARPMRIRVIHALSEACKKVNDVVPTYVGDTATHTCTADDVLTSKKLRFLTSVLDEAVALLARAYRVLPTPAFSMDANACNRVPSDALVVNGDTDLVILVTAAPVQQADATIAWAMACLTLPERRVCGDDAPPLVRPVVGQINFVPSAMSLEATSRDVRVAMHELTHVLGFHNLESQLRRYVREDGTCTDGMTEDQVGVRNVWRPGLGKTVTIVTTPRVLRAARAHFGCDTLDGLEIEDAGGAGTKSSHWKKRLLYAEALVGVVSSAELFYSSMTMAALEDMGLVYANYDVAEDGLSWGRARGCSFVHDSCKTLVRATTRAPDDKGVDGSEFCLTVEANTAQHCTFDRFAIGFCNTVEYNSPLPMQYRYFDDDGRRGGPLDTMDYCPAVDAYQNAQCTDMRNSNNVVNAKGSELGPHSRCFESNLITNALPSFGHGVACYPAACTPAGQLLLRVQGQTVGCPADGSPGRADTSRLRTVSGTITCPRARDICADQDSSGLSALPRNVRPPFTHSPVSIFQQH